MDAGSTLMDSFARLLTQGLNETLFFDEELQDPHRKKALAATQHQHAVDCLNPASSRRSVGQQVRARRQDAGQQPHVPNPLSRKDTGLSRAQPAQQLDRAHAHMKHKMQLMRSQPAAADAEEEFEAVTEREAEEQGSGLLDVFMGFGARATELLHTLDQGFDEIFDPSPAKPQQQHQHQHQQASGEPHQQRQANTSSPTRSARAAPWPRAEHPNPAASDGLPLANALLLQHPPLSPTQNTISAPRGDHNTQILCSSTGSCSTTPTPQRRVQLQPQLRSSGGRKRGGPGSTLVKGAPRSEVSRVQGTDTVPRGTALLTGSDRRKTQGSQAAEEWGSMAWGESSDEWDSPAKAHADDGDDPQTPRRSQQQQQRQIQRGSSGFNEEWGSGPNSSGSSIRAGRAGKVGKAATCGADSSAGSTSTSNSSSGKMLLSRRATAEQGSPLSGAESSRSACSSSHAHAAIMASWRQGAQPQDSPARSSPTAAQPQPQGSPSQPQESHAHKSPLSLKTQRQPQALHAQDSPLELPVSEQNSQSVSKVPRCAGSPQHQQQRHQEAQEQHRQQQQQQRPGEGREVSCAGCYLLAQELQQARQECWELKEDSHRLRIRSVAGSLEEDPCLSEAIRQQLECLMAEKARLAEDNHRLARENAGLQQLLEYMECCGCFGDGGLSAEGGTLDPLEAQGCPSYEEDAGWGAVDGGRQGSFNVGAAGWEVVDAGGQGCVEQQELLGLSSSLTCQDEGSLQQRQQQQRQQQVHSSDPGTHALEGPAYPQQKQQARPQAATAAAAAAAAPISGTSQEDLESLSQIWSQAVSSCTPSRPPLPSLSHCASPSHTSPAHACSARQQLLSRMRASSRPSSPSPATPASHHSLLRLRAFSPSPPSKEQQQQQLQPLGWSPAAPMSPFTAAAAAVRAAASAPSSPPPAMPTAALPTPTLAATTAAAASSSSPAPSANAPSPAPTETPYPPTGGLAPPSCDATVTAFITAADPTPPPLPTPEVSTHVPVPPSPQSISQTNNSRCTRTTEPPHTCLEEQHFAPLTPPSCSLDVSWPTQPVQESTHAPQPQLHTPQPQDHSHASLASPCEPSLLAQRKGPLEVDIPQGFWPGACPVVEQLSQGDDMCSNLPPALCGVDHQEGSAQKVKEQTEQPTPVPSLPTPEQQQQLPVSRRIFLAE